MVTQNSLAIFVAALLFISAFSFAAEVQSTSGGPPAKFTGTLDVVKTAPESASMGEEFTVSIFVTNKGSSSVDAYIVEYLGNVEAVSPQPTVANVTDIDAAHPPELTWKVTLAPGAAQSVEYKIKPKTVGPLSIGPTSVVVPGGKFFSNPLTVSVACSTSPGCDDSIGETPLTCPDKCGGSPDAEPEAAPELQVIPTPAYKAPADPMNVTTAQEKRSPFKGFS